MKRIAHYVGYSRNYGDLAIQYSMMHTLRKASTEVLEFYPINLKEGSVLGPSQVKFINNNCNMFILGGGGLIMHGDGFNTASGWQFNITKTALDAIEVPIVGYSIGYNCFPHDAPLPSNAIRHILATVKRCQLFSCRDDGSAKALEDLGAPKVKVTPDPALFCPYAHVHLPELDRYKVRIGFSWAGDREKERFGGYTVYEQLTPLLRRLKKVADDIDAIIVHIPHVSRYDIQHTAAMELNLKDRFFDVSKHMPSLYPEDFLHTPYFVGLYDRMDLVIGMRGHSNIIPVGLGRPTIALGKHSKNKFFADMVGIPVVEEDGPELEKLIYTMLGEGVSKFTENKVKELKETLDAFNKEVLNVDSGRFFKPNSNVLGTN